MNVATVRIWGKKVGAVQWIDDGYARFEFDPRFFGFQWDLSPIAMPMPATPRANRLFSFQDLRNSSFRGLPGLLADSLPDRYGNELINGWLTSQGRPANSLNPVETLCFIGKRGMGALEFETAVSAINSRSSQVEISGLVDIAERIL
ncbi:MAG: HipA N-terminal domain-containing protein, partial [Cytophagales bacterium]|nr:HipA N-terminal domain-containing protein [Cytophagales bacterium]